LQAGLPGKPVLLQRFGSAKIAVAGFDFRSVAGGFGNTSLVFFDELQPVAGDLLLSLIRLLLSARSAILW
jgi:hypothetical protein